MTKSAEPTELERKIILATMTRFVEISLDPAHNAPLLPTKLKGRSSKTLAPVETIFIAFLIRLFARASNGKLANLIQGFVMILREKHERNVFLNTAFANTARIYIAHQQRYKPDWVDEDIGVLVGQPRSTRRRRSAEDDGDYTPSTTEIFRTQRHRNDD